MPNLLVAHSFDFSYVFKTVSTRWYYYVFLAVFVIVLFCFFFFKKQKKRNNLSITQKIVYTALLTALCTVTNIFDIKASDLLQISLVATIGFVSGYLLGGGLGFTVCFVGDLLGAIIYPAGPYNPIIGIGTGFWGLVPGIAFSFFKGKDFVKTIISFVISFLIISAGINTLGFCLMYPTRYTFESLLPLLPFKLITATLNCIVCILLVKVFPRILPKDKFNL